MTETLEVLTYRLVPGTTAETYLALVERTLPRIAAQPGLLSRNLASDGETWTEVCLWQSRAHADAAGEAIMSDPAVAPLMAAIDAASLAMRFQPLVWPRRP